MVYLIDGFSSDGSQVIQLGINQIDINKRNDRGQLAALAQFDGIVCPGLIMVEHIFRGLERPLSDDDSNDADGHKLVYAWKPNWDFEWPDRYGRPQKLPPVANGVFVTIISPNDRHQEAWPEVYGWIDRWNWVGEDPELPGAPINWKTRYTERLYTRKGA